jgi:hypothetical protein
MHAAVATKDAAQALSTGDFGGAGASLCQRSVAQSLWALIEETPEMRRLARRRRRTATGFEVLYDGGPSNERSEV